MPTESEIDKSLLKRVIEEEFGIGISSMTLVPKVRAARGYLIEGLDHERFFLKIFTDDNIPDSAFRFAHDLFYKVGIANVVHPVTAKSGELRIRTGESYIALFRLIAGKTAEESRFNDSQLEKLGEPLGQDASIEESRRGIFDEGEF